jgi:hypothetical protein
VSPGARFQLFYCEIFFDSADTNSPNFKFKIKQLICACTRRGGPAQWAHLIFGRWCLRSGCCCVVIWRPIWTVLLARQASAACRGAGGTDPASTISPCQVIWQLYTFLWPAPAGLSRVGTPRADFLTAPLSYFNKKIKLRYLRWLCDLRGRFNLLLRLPSTSEAAFKQKKNPCAQHHG